MSKASSFHKFKILKLIIDKKKILKKLSLNPQISSDLRKM